MSQERGFWIYAAVVPSATVSLQGVNADLVGGATPSENSSDLVVAKIGVTDEPSPYRRLQQGLVKCIQCHGLKEVERLSQDEVEELVKEKKALPESLLESPSKTTLTLPKPSSDLGFCFIKPEAVANLPAGDAADETEKAKALRLAVDKELLGGKMDNHRFCKIGSSIHWSKTIFGHQEVFSACHDLFLLTRKDFDSLFIDKMMTKDAAGGALYVPKQIQSLDELTTAKEVEAASEAAEKDDEKEDLLTPVNVRKVIYTIDFKRWDPTAAAVDTPSAPPPAAPSNSSGGGKKKGKKGKAEAQQPAAPAAESAAVDNTLLPTASVQVVWTGIKTSIIRNWYVAKEEDIAAANVESDDDDDDAASDDSEERKRKQLQIGASEAF